MINNDTTLLEEAYKSIYLNEMARERINVGGMSAMPSTTKVKNVAKSEEESEERKVQAGLKIQENLKRLESDANDLDAARDIIYTIANFGEGREDFLINGEEMTYEEIYRKILDLMTTPENDPKLLMVHRDPVTFQRTAGVKKDEYLYRYIGGAKRGEEGKIREPIAGRTVGHYELFRIILDALGEETQTMSVKERSEGSDLLYYFGKRMKVNFNDEHIGFYQGGVFWPNQTGKEMKIYDPEILEDKFHGGWYGLKGHSWNRFYKENSNRLKFYDEQMFVYRSTFHLPSEGPVTQALFDRTARRIPRYEGEPLVVSLPWPIKSYTDIKAMKGKPAIYIKDLLHSEEAEEHFKTIYPKEDYPQLYKKGRDVGMIAGERPDSAEVPMPSGGEETPTESENE
jgi:hypothetical protein